jgi:hypothetical protein
MGTQLADAKVSRYGSKSVFIVLAFLYAQRPALQLRRPKRS